jgi:hypothetical protein
MTGFYSSLDLFISALLSPLLIVACGFSGDRRLYTFRSRFWFRHSVASSQIQEMFTYHEAGAAWHRIFSRTANSIPYGIWFSRKPLLTNFRPFGIRTISTRHRLAVPLRCRTSSQKIRQRVRSGDGNSPFSGGLESSVDQEESACDSQPNAAPAPIDDSADCYSGVLNEPGPDALSYLADHLPNV